MCALANSLRRFMPVYKWFCGISCVIISNIQKSQLDTRITVANNIYKTVHFMCLIGLCRSLHWILVYQITYFIHDEIETKQLNIQINRFISWWSYKIAYQAHYRRVLSLFSLPGFEPPPPPLKCPWFLTTADLSVIDQYDPGVAVNGQRWPDFAC